jgi:hypothetical protein
MTATYDPTSIIGQVRLLAQDTDITNPIFDDDEITAFLILQKSNVFLAAAAALDVVAASEIYIQKRIKLLDLVTDGVQEFTGLHALAQSYRDLVNQGLDSTLAPFDWAEQVTDEFSERERLLKQLLRLQSST